jgi:hypothetical protein
VHTWLKQQVQFLLLGSAGHSKDFFSMTKLLAFFLFENELKKLNESF